MKSEIKKVNCIIDTDPGVDDCVAIALSLFDEYMDIKLITTVNGNLDLETVTRNMMHLLEKFKRTDIPVAKGADKALCRVSPNASYIHQKTGMGGYNPPEKVKTKPIETHAIEAMYETIKLFTLQTTVNWFGIFIVMITSFIFGIISIKLMLKIVKSNKLYFFSFYLIVLSLVMLFLF